MSDKPKDDHAPKPGTDDGRDRTLTEKEEDEAGGANKTTPGPIYDV
ncbi:hypothetical protein [Azospirillum agricola]|nr:hypothetical protein [Azospirillum agricola]SMH45818.1 hypothetical protein SAMN02982994_2296 [Azospirillum lipoferum]